MGGTSPGVGWCRGGVMPKRDRQGGDVGSDEPAPRRSDRDRGARDVPRTPSASSDRAAEGTAARGRGSSKKSRSASQRRVRVRVAEGVYKDRYGLAATVKVRGVQREMRFPRGTSLRTIRERRDELRARLLALPVGERHTLRHDAGRYLDQVRSTLTSFSDRRRDLQAWLPAFGHLRTLMLGSHLGALNAQLHEWRRTLAAVSCNHRRNALTNLVRVLYGRRASMELVDLVRFAPAPPRPRWIDRQHITDVLHQLRPGSKTRVRLELMHWTGMRPSQMARLRTDDFRLDDPIPYVAVPRGKGGRVAAVPLVPEGIAAARAFLDAQAFGPWSRGGVNNTLRAAARRAGRAAFTVYQIRHSFAAGLRRSGADVADIQDLYGHTHPETTKIYAPPELAKHRAALERLRRSDAGEAPGIASGGSLSG